MRDRTSTWFTHTSLGSWDPQGCLVCVIDDPTEAVRAVITLRAGGFSAEHLRLFLASEMLAFNEALHRQNALVQVFNLLTNLTDDAAFEAEYRDEARQGHPILVIYAPQGERSEWARTLLQGYCVHTVKHYSPWIVRGFDEPGAVEIDEPQAR